MHPLNSLRGLTVNYFYIWHMTLKRDIKLQLFVRQTGDKLYGYSAIKCHGEFSDVILSSPSTSAKVKDTKAFNDQQKM